MNQIPFHLDSTRKAQTFFVGVLFHHYHFGHVSKCDALQYWLETDFHNLQPMESASGFFCSFVGRAKCFQRLNVFEYRIFRAFQEPLNLHL